MWLPRLGLVAGLVGFSACAPRTPPALRPELADRYPVHVVQAGENLYRISLEYGVTVEALAALNEIDDPTELSVGQRLLIPGRVSAATPPPPASPPRPPTRGPAAPAVRCPANEPDDLPISHDGFSWPVDGVVLAGFGKVDGVPHPGLDIGAPPWTPIWAARPGEVVYVGPQAGFGNVIILRHGPGSFTLYARNAMSCVDEGERVSRGRVIGHVGDGPDTGVPYLYFEVREDGRPVDPKTRLPR